MPIDYRRPLFSKYLDQQLTVLRLSEQAHRALDTSDGDYSTRNIGSLEYHSWGQSSPLLEYHYFKLAEDSFDRGLHLLFIRNTICRGIEISSSKRAACWVVQDLGKNCVGINSEHIYIWEHMLQVVGHIDQ
jgi:hypothetical protein